MVFLAEQNEGVSGTRNPVGVQFTGASLFHWRSGKRHRMALACSWVLRHHSSRRPGTSSGNLVVWSQHGRLSSVISTERSRWSGVDAQMVRAGVLQQRFRQRLAGWVGIDLGNNRIHEIQQVAGGVISLSLGRRAQSRGHTVDQRRQRQLCGCRRGRLIFSVSFFHAERVLLVGYCCGHQSSTVLFLRLEEEVGAPGVGVANCEEGPFTGIEEGNLGILGDTRGKDKKRWSEFA